MGADLVGGDMGGVPRCDLGGVPSSVDADFVGDELAMPGSAVAVAADLCDFSSPWASMPSIGDTDSGCSEARSPLQGGSLDKKHTRRHTSRACEPFLG